MKLLIDCFGRSVRLTDERLAHILDHLEMAGMEGAIDLTLRDPEIVRISHSDAAVKLFYDFHANTLVGSKWLCVVVKYGSDDAFVVTAYLTSQPKAGEDLWPIK